MINLLFLTLTVHSLDTNNCLDVLCGSSSNQCMVQSSSFITVNPCPASSTCPGLSTILSNPGPYENLKCVPSGSSDPCQSYWGSGNSPAGWTCCLNSDCLSNQCVSQTCAGKAQGAICKSSGECAAGFYCQNICVASFIDGQTCSSDDVCGVGSGCNKGSCTALFSLSLGSAADDKKFCLSYYLANGVCDAVLVYSTDSVVSPIEPDFVCNIGDICYYYTVISGKKVGQQDCLCVGVGGQTTGYCPFVDGMGNVDWTIRMNYNAGNCSGVLAHTDNLDYLYVCGAVSEYEYEFYTNITQQRTFWSVYNGGSLMECASDLNLFNGQNYFNCSSTILFPGFLFILNT